MRKTGRVGDDRIRNERLIADRIRVNARLPAPIKHFGNHLSLPLNVAAPETLQAGDQSRIADHVRHQLRGIAANREELQACIADEAIEDVVRSEAHSVTVSLKFIAQSYKRLDITPTADYLDDDVQLHGEDIRF